jgi:hypothetical protein
MSVEQTLECDLKTEVDFVPRGPDFEMRLWKSTLDCHVKQTLHVTSRLCATRSGLKMEKTKSTFRKAKANKKLEKMNSRTARAVLRLRLLKSTCATGVGLGVLSVKICQPSHEFTFGVGMTFISYPLVLTPVV